MGEFPTPDEVQEWLDQQAGQEAPDVGGFGMSEVGKLSMTIKGDAGLPPCQKGALGQSIAIAIVAAFETVKDDLPPDLRLEYEVDATVYVDKRGGAA
jgi:hypothetical protein